MATMNASAIKLRFVFNHKARTVTPVRSRAASSWVVKNVAMNVADNSWSWMRKVIGRQIEADLRREMSHLAQEYLRLIVGISGNNEGPKGKLQTATAPNSFSPGLASYNMHIAWDERSHDYLERKRRERGHTQWFRYDNVLKRTMGKASTWFGAFGPVEVQVVRSGQSMSQSQATEAGFTERFSMGGYGSSARVQIGTVRVFAMRAITKQMLPALAAGIDDWAEDGVASGLIRRFPRDIQHGLAPNRKFVPYRHSVEPFLAFYLTRAIPNAVMRRLEEGLDADIRRE